MLIHHADRVEYGGVRRYLVGCGILALYVEHVTDTAERILHNFPLPGITVALLNKERAARGYRAFLSSFIYA